MNPTPTIPINSVPCFCPTWDEIKGKAHMYRTARLRSTGQHVKLAGLHGPGSFFVNIPGPKGHPGYKVTYTTEELCDFCL